MVCERVRVWAHICTYKHVEGRGQCQVSSSITLLYWEGSLTEPGCYQCSKTGWPVTGFFPSLPFQCWDIYVGAKLRPPWLSHWAISPALGMVLFKSVLIKFEYIQIQLSRTPAVTRWNTRDLSTNVFFIFPGCMSLDLLWIFKALWLFCSSPNSLSRYSHLAWWHNLGQGWLQCLG